MSAAFTLRPFQLALAAIALAVVGCFSAAQADEGVASRFARTKLWLNPFAPRLLNPQPLPPKSVLTTPGGDRMLNPQPLPPKSIFTIPGGDRMLNPQPLPPKAVLLRRS